MCWDLSMGEVKLTVLSGMTPFIPNLHETIHEPDLKLV
jgi:hypothetical protein